MGVNCYDNKDNDENISISKENINIINEKVEKNLCKIIGGNGGIELGFFCMIPFPNNNNLLPVLITSNKVIKKGDINKNGNIQLIINNNNKEILMNEFRKSYISTESNNIAIIEIKQEDGLDIKSFLLLDNIIFEPKLDHINYNQNHFQTNHKYTLFVLKKNKNNNCLIGYLLKDENVRFGSPIINQSNYKVIGIIVNNYININLLSKSILNFQEKFEVFKKIYELSNNKNNNSNNYSDEIKIKYKISEEENIRIFGDEFVNNNKNLCKIIINGKEEELCPFYNTKNINLKKDKNDKILQIKLKGINNITNMSNMFCFCYSLIKVDFSKINISKVIYLNNLFCGCESLKSLSGLSNWNISNIIDISGMFTGCTSLTSLPDISKWNINNITDINNLFSECSSITSLPDISKWNTNKITNMNNLFSKCSSLLSLPDISNWNTSNVSNMNNMFAECSKLVLLSDISKWNIINVTNVTRMFYKCSSLLSLPDISKWNTSNIKHMNSLFEGCSSLKTLPDISKWNTNNVTSMYSMFSGCSSLTSLPDISKWNTKNVLDMNSMFYECSSIISLPDISKWNTNNVSNMEEMFEGCNSSLIIPVKFK